jgi:collagen type IV alpha
MAAAAVPAADAALAALAADGGDAAGDAGAAEGGTGAGGGGAAGGASCWLVNETGAPLSFLVAVSPLPPGAAAAALAAGGSGGVASGRRPVALRARDAGAARFGGQWVEYPDGGGGAATAGSAGGDDPGGPATPRAPAAGGAGAGAGAPGAFLYLQLAGQRGVFGPVPLSQQGASLHALQDAGGPGGGALRWDAWLGSWWGVWQSAAVRRADHPRAPPVAPRREIDPGPPPPAAPPPLGPRPSCATCGRTATGPTWWRSTPAWRS